MIKLYDMPLSGNCQKVRMFLSMLGLDYEIVPVNTLAGEQKKPDYLAINPMGKVPALDDDGLVIWDSQAILVYLARKYGSTDWYPDDAVGMAAVQKWLCIAVNEMFNGCAVARAIKIFDRPMDPEPAKKLATATLGGQIEGTPIWCRFGVDAGNYPVLNCANSEGLRLTLWPEGDFDAPLDCP